MSETMLAGYTAVVFGLGVVSGFVLARVTRKASK